MSLSAFLAENAVPVENIKFVASKRFLGEDGNPIPWEIKTITGTEDEALRKSCAKRVPVPGKKNQYQKETDYDLYLGKLAVACTVFPNLNDKELQDSYKVMGADALLKTMLTPGEYAEYLTKIQEVCGFDMSFVIMLSFRGSWGANSRKLKRHGIPRMIFLIISSFPPLETWAFPGGKRFWGSPPKARTVLKIAGSVF